MAMPVVPHEITTIEELLALPDDGLRHELLDGLHVVSPAPMPPHQFIHAEFYARLWPIKHAGNGLLVLSSPADIRLGPRTLVQPDLFVIRRPDGQRVRQWTEVGVPVLTIEILSPSTAGRDRVTKRDIYQRAGVGEYWIVDVDARVVERWRPADQRPEIVAGELVWHPLPDIEPVRIDLPALFTEALGEP